MPHETHHPNCVLVDGYLVQDHPVYAAWAGMKQRCKNTKMAQFHDYGGRGITYCDRWKHFANFAADVGLPPFEGASIDRRDNDRGYGPDNHRWATRMEQNSNRRTFKTNKFDAGGIHQARNGHFCARYAVNGTRYNLGRFATVEEATAYREQFIALLKVDPIKAFEMLVRRARLDSSTGVRGITSAPSGFIVRKTVNKARVYVGHSLTFSGALQMLESVS
jgi:hypothetical protein